MEEVWGELKTGLLEVADTVCGNKNVDQSAKKLGSGMRMLQQQ